MSEKNTRRERLVRYKSLDDMPPPRPLSKKFRAMSDEEVERRARSDPDAGLIPSDFWDHAKVWTPERKEQITLRLDPDVIRWFKRTGKGYQTRMGSILKSYVAAKKQRA